MSTAGLDDDRETTLTWAQGTAAFAGVMLLMLASFHFLQGLAAVLEDEVLIVGIEYTYKLDVTTWGWIHMILALIAVAIGLGILSGNAVANGAGIGIAFLSALSAFAFLPYYPIWGIIIIAFDALVIWALCVQIARR